MGNLDKTSGFPPVFHRDLECQEAKGRATDGLQTPLTLLIFTFRSSMSDFSLIEILSHSKGRKKATLPQGYVSFPHTSPSDHETHTQNDACHLYAAMKERAKKRLFLGH